MEMDKKRERGSYFARLNDLSKGSPFLTPLLTVDGKDFSGEGCVIFYADFNCLKVSK
jgi:hypothetical protein